MEGSSSQILQIARELKGSCAQMLQITCKIKSPSAKMQITCKMKGSSSKMLQIACSMEGKWQDRCRGRKTEQIRKKIPHDRGKIPRRDSAPDDDDDEEEEEEDKQEEKDGDDHGAKNGSAHAVLHTWPFCKRHKSTFRVLLPSPSHVLWWRINCPTAMSKWHAVYGQQFGYSVHCCGKRGSLLQAVVFLGPATGVSRYHIVSETLDGLTVDYVFCDSLRFILRSALSTARKHLLHTLCMYIYIYVLCFAFKWR